MSLQLSEDDEQPVERKKAKRKVAVQSDDEEEDEEGKHYALAKYHVWVFQNIHRIKGPILAKKSLYDVSSDAKNNLLLWYLCNLFFLRLTHISYLQCCKQFVIFLLFADDEDRLREELKDLIDDAPIDESGSDGEDSDEGPTKKRKKSDDELDDRLEDEDYDLIEENLGVKVARV